MKCPYCIKICKICGKTLVANTMNFHKKANGKYGLRAECKACKSIIDKNHRINNKDKISAQRKKYREKNKDKIKEQKHNSYIKNKESYSKYQKEYRKKNKEKLTKYAKVYRINNKEKINLSYKTWAINNPDKILNIRNKRRAQKENGIGINKEQWLECMNFFEWKCAYSGEPLTEDNRSLDHVIPLSKNGQHSIWNIVPTTRSINSSKNKSDMLEWYKKQTFYSEERLNKIYDWLEYSSKIWVLDH